MKIFIIILIAIICILGYIIFQYNLITTMRKKVKQSKSSIDVYLMQRFDLIPNLIDCVKEYASYEEDTLVKVTQMRDKYYNTKNLNEGAKLNDECNKILLNAEQYPELKASEHFLNLQKNLSKMENKLQAARKLYNSEVTVYNTKISVIPTNIIASIFKFTEEELFKADEGVENNINIDL